MRRLLGEQHRARRKEALAATARALGGRGRDPWQAPERSALLDPDEVHSRAKRRRLARRIARRAYKDA